MIRAYDEYGNIIDLVEWEKKIRSKAIDDFAILMKEAMNHDWATTKICDQIIYNRLFDKCEEIAEQLKVGDKNVNNE